MQRYPDECVEEKKEERKGKGCLVNSLRRERERESKTADLM
jgi:hypothetical protein